MPEQIYNGVLDENKLQELQDILFPTEEIECFAVLEMVPYGYMEEHTRLEGLQFINYFPTLKTWEWSRGRIFSPDGELRWEVQQDGCHVYYAGSSKDVSSYLEHLSEQFEVSEPQGFYLWGELLSKDDLKMMGLAGLEAQYLETKIPRLFNYPITSAAKKRCILNMVCFSNPDNLIPQYFRLHSLEEVE